MTIFSFKLHAMNEYIKSVKDRDPVATSALGIILTNPGVKSAFSQLKFILLLIFDDRVMI